MENPRATSTGPVTTGAWFSLAGDDRLLPDVGPATQRLQRAVTHPYSLGPRPLGEFIAELLDTHTIAPEAFNRLLAWQRLDPGIVSTLEAHRFPTRRPMEMPR